MSRIGSLLVKKELLTEEQLTQANEARKQDGQSLISTLVSLEFLNEDDIIETISSQYGIPIAEKLSTTPIAETAIKMIPHELSLKYMLLPYSLEGKTLKVVMSDPSNMTALNDIKFMTGLDVQVLVGKESDLKVLQEKLYEGNVSYDNILDDFDEEDIEVIDSEEEVNIAELEKSTADAPVVKLVNAILTDAIKKGASDIHIEPYEKHFRVRFRIDGMLYEIMKPPMRLKNAITSRLKIMSELDIAERRLPQDGRIKLKLGRDREMDFRVNVLPTLFGEKVVLRLLDKSNLQLDMTKLGFFEEQLKDYKESISKPYGMVLVTGPTGSGKTTTLYSGLADLNKVGTNISTAEDPVEFNLMGINQAQVNEDIGFSFSGALRAFLRQDPDIIMVGEIRDLVTAQIAIKASLTGHLVLSTLHTNDAPATVGRLLNMGVEPFLVASSINCIVAQRLARRLCTCAEEVKEEIQTLVGIGIPEEDAKKTKVMGPKGCERCSDTGYKGRVALYEIMVMNDEIRQAILREASVTELKEVCKGTGMLTLRDSALIRLKEGTTTVEEVLRTTSVD